MMHNRRRMDQLKNFLKKGNPGDSVCIAWKSKIPFSFVRVNVNNMRIWNFSRNTVNRRGSFNGKSIHAFFDRMIFITTDFTIDCHHPIQIPFCAFGTTVGTTSGTFLFFRSADRNHSFIIQALQFLQCWSARRT